ncbi:hypothetical protein NDU88_006032 [Pleurodeles waltl]|uniref:Uncharacterized protein n=1 Tax=Pleurodeles waltl TaxID=8319 RepID=A0AAV7WWD9_PLEWA|nr:hypothetical protein NDU88_006032 [Pleurodeles waltl]
MLHQFQGLIRFPFHIRVAVPRALPFSVKVYVRSVALLRPLETSTEAQKGPLTPLGWKTAAAREPTRPPSTLPPRVYNRQSIINHYPDVCRNKFEHVLETARKEASSSLMWVTTRATTVHICSRGKV